MDINKWINHYRSIYIYGKTNTGKTTTIMDILKNEKYDYSIVSDNRALSLYVLTRNVERFYKLYNEQVLQSLHDFGFTRSFNTPLIMNQTDCSI